MPGSILGTRVTRVEDPELLMGRGRFVGDIRIDGLASVAFVRSPIAHGYISRIDVSAAEQAGGMLAIFTAATVGVAPFHYFMTLNESCARPWGAFNRPPRWPWQPHHGTVVT
ncbi:MAG TPA: hypothetical protein VKI99_10915 [Candidatus Dormibacteraeota bacterium]|nr:hypothetical protein [Candidatus Dormibacteraeota bacterium]